MNYKFRKFLEKLIIPGKILGIVFVIIHLYRNGIDFDPLWIVFYLGIILLVATVWFFANYLMGVFSKKYEESMNSEETALTYKLSNLCADVKRRPWLLLLIPGEDGIFFLPLLYIGINPLTAFAASALFALAHASYKSVSAMFGTFLIAFLVCLTILPNGIMPLIIGHLILDSTVFLILIYVEKKEARKRAAAWERDFGNIEE